MTTNGQSSQPGKSVFGKSAPRSLNSSAYLRLCTVAGGHIPSRLSACLKVGRNERLALTDEYASPESAVISSLSTFKTSSGDGYRPTSLQLITETRTTVEEIQEAEKPHDYEYRVKLIPYIDPLSTEYTSDPNLPRKFGVVYDAAGKFSVAKSLFEAVVEKDKRIFGPRHPDTLTLMFELTNYYRAGEPREAVKLYTTVIEGRIGSYAPGHLPSKGLSFRGLSGARNIYKSILTSSDFYCKGQGRFQNEKSLPTKLVITEKKLLADVLQQMFGLEDLDRLKAAEDIATQALETRRQISGDDHPRTLACYAIVARIHFRQGQFDNAVKIQEEIDAI
ncbi:hypothetical protein RSAG8_04876, partial [Rhizoctonia solani AG-8 WAC10335]